LKKYVPVSTTGEPAAIKLPEDLTFVGNSYARDAGATFAVARHEMTELNKLNGPSITRIIGFTLKK
jgi:hypothetical protein